MGGCGRNTDTPWVEKKENNKATSMGRMVLVPVVHLNPDFAGKTHTHILDQRYLLNKLLDPGGNLRGNSPLRASVNESPRRLSVLIFFFIFPAGAWPSPHGEYPGTLSGIIGVLIKFWWLQAKELFPPSYITMFTHQGSIFNLSFN